MSTGDRPRRHRDHLGRDRLGDDADPEAGRRRLPGALADALEQVVRDHGWSERLQGARVHDVWETTVGGDLARHVQPLRLHGGVLVLQADSAVWATQVRYLTGDLTQRLNTALGAELVTKVHVTVLGDERSRRR
ncbi:DUF721 domain-containing protein [Egibacter rhizosphaerae]|uniref:DUF721 domain-containing protein n=1 Tax=Egibacter rhizosphaerae TaxID=1670831 RepID=UPI0013F16DEE|nr:DUF721 domain-containing protein [Egibacter rhizosphaerae]